MYTKGTFGGVNESSGTSYSVGAGVGCELGDVGLLVGCPEGAAEGSPEG